MGVIETRTFKNGNSVAVRLPRELGFAADMPVRIERTGGGITIRPAVDPIAEKRKVLEFVAELRALAATQPLPISNPDDERMEFPDRPGLY